MWPVGKQQMLLCLQRQMFLIILSPLQGNLNSFPWKGSSADAEVLEEEATAMFGKAETHPWFSESRMEGGQ